MRKFLLTLSLTFCAFAFASASNENPKYEMRANWVATVANIDWPKTYRITNPGNPNEIKNQKYELTRILDKMVAGNMNTVFLQIRPMSDALYPSDIVCWSSYLTGTRGVDPGYDPLAFAIEECHKRGLELHGWMNPYRYENSSVTHPTSDYMQQQHPNWIVRVGSESILNPGLPDVRKHIAEVTKEVLVKYPEIDGIVWDDYFYLSSFTDNTDKATYLANNPKGLGIKDWRRDNVNQTVKQVYDTIQAVAPGVRFGISPRGIWGTDAQAAKNLYGVTLPAGISGADNFNTIYCDGLAWLSQGTIDYISPQLYWPTYQTAQSYTVLAPWWYSVAKKYNRHFYSSQGAYRGWALSEIDKQIDINREADPVAPGTVFYNTTSYLNYNYSEYLKLVRFSTPAINPVMTWYKPENIGPALNVKLSGDTLSWDAPAYGRRYVIYCIPEGSQDNPSSYSVAANIAGTAYGTSFNTKNFKDKYSTHRFSVRTLDKFGYESAPAYTVISDNVIPTENQPIISREGDGVLIQMKGEFNINIFSVSGFRVASATTNDTYTCSLERGVYIIRVNNKSYKFVY